MSYASRSQSVIGASTSSRWVMRIWFAYFFDFAVILEDLGNLDDARLLYARFIQQPEAGPVKEVDELILRQRDLEDMLSRAREALG